MFHWYCNDLLHMTMRASSIEKINFWTQFSMIINYSQLSFASCLLSLRTGFPWQRIFFGITPHSVCPVTMLKYMGKTPMKWILFLWNSIRISAAVLDENYCIRFLKLWHYSDRYGTQIYWCCIFVQIKPKALSTSLLIMTFMRCLPTSSISSFPASMLQY